MLIRFGFATIVCCLLAMIFCSRLSGQQVNLTGTTPCDAYIRAQLKISPGDSLEMIKWNGTITATGANAGTFSLTAIYGRGIPSTEQLYNGGTKIIATGKYTASPVANSRRELYKLESPLFRSPVYLIKMDDNIFHFADKNKKLLVGNGGWGYVLNKK